VHCRIKHCTNISSGYTILNVFSFSFSFTTATSSDAATAFCSLLRPLLLEGEGKLGLTMNIVVSISAKDKRELSFFFDENQQGVIPGS